MNITNISPRSARKILNDAFDANDGQTSRHTLGELLIRMGRMTEDQAAKALDMQRKTGAAFGKSAMRLGFIRQDDLNYALGVQLGFLHETKERVAVPREITVAQNPYSQASEQFRHMRTRLVTGATRDKIDLFSIASADAHTDATFVAVNLAASLAQLGRRTLLIDGNLRKPTLAKLFGGAREPGLVELVRGSASYDDVVSATLVKSLDLLPSGGPIEDSQLILGDPGFALMLKRAQAAYENVIVLTSAFGATTDGEFAWASTGRLLVLAKKNETRSHNLTRMRSVVRSAGAEIIGAVMVA